MSHLRDAGMGSQWYHRRTSTMSRSGILWGRLAHHPCPASDTKAVAESSSAVTFLPGQSTQTWSKL